MNEAAQRRGRSRGLNRVTIIGNLGGDPELRFTNNGIPFARFSVAVNSTVGGRDSEQREHTEWFRVVTWRQLAEIANEYLRKGARVCIEGRLETHEWQDREGQKRTTTELIARDLLLLGGGGGDDRATDGGAPSESAPADSADEEITPDDLPF